MTLDMADIDTDALALTAREDWWWEPCSPDHPDDEADLRNDAEHDRRPEGTDAFSGVLVRL